MYELDYKKSTVLALLRILQTETDENHTLNNRDLLRLLKQKYGIDMDRKTLRRQLLALEDAGYSIEYDAIERGDSPIWKNIYLEHTFTNGELMLLVDGLVFSRHLSLPRCRELIGKLEGLASKYFSSRMQYVSRQPQDKTDSSELFYTIEMLDEAIQQGHKVRFSYAFYHSDKKQHLRKNRDGSVRRYTMSPYRMAAKEGRYYLICNDGYHDDVSNYRLDRIRDIEIINEPIRPFREVGGAESLSLSDYMKKHIFMFTGREVEARFRIPETTVSEVFGMFGSENIHYEPEPNGNVIVTAHVIDDAMLQFAKTCLPDVEILSPTYLREKMKTQLEYILSRYSDCPCTRNEK